MTRTCLIEASDEHFAEILSGTMSAPLRLAVDGIGAPDIIEMLRALAHSVAERFAPAAWLIVEADEVIGLCSVVTPPVGDGVIDIGYGIAVSWRGRGCATRAVAAVVRWASADPRVLALTADTAIANAPSQRVLERDGFVRIGTRTDPEDGPMIRWWLDSASR